MIPSLDETEQILPQDLKNHTDMYPVWTFVLERIQQTDHMFLAWMIRIRLNDLVQQFDLIDGRLRIVRGRADHLQRDMSARVRVS